MTKAAEEEKIFNYVVMLMMLSTVVHQYVKQTKQALKNRRFRKTIKVIHFVSSLVVVNLI